MGDPVNNNPLNSSDFLPSRGGSDRLVGSDLLQAMAAILAQYKTSLSFNADQQPTDIQTVTIDLTTARTLANPIRIGFPFKSYFVVASTGGANATFNLHYSTQDISAVGIPLSIKDSGILEFPVRQAYLTNAAQSGTMTILFSVTTEFRSGSQISLSSGGVSITEGSTLSTRTNVGLTLTSSTASIILPADSSRKVETIQNFTGQTLWLGDSTVTDLSGAKPGIQINDGDIFIWKNTAALYAYQNGSTLTDAQVSRNLET